MRGTSSAVTKALFWSVVVKKELGQSLLLHPCSNSLLWPSDLNHDWKTKFMNASGSKVLRHPSEETHWCWTHPIFLISATTPAGCVAARLLWHSFTFASLTNKKIKNKIKKRHLVSRGTKEEKCRAREVNLTVSVQMETLHRAFQTAYVCTYTMFLKKGTKIVFTEAVNGGYLPHFVWTHH